MSGKVRLVPFGDTVGWHTWGDGLEMMAATILYRYEGNLVALPYIITRDLYDAENRDEILEHVALEWIAEHPFPGGLRGDAMKPCPFCGQKAEVVRQESWGWVARCSVCHARIGPKITKSLAVEAWNERGGNGQRDDDRAC